MSAAIYNLTIAQGEDFYIELTLDNNGVPLDLTGYTFAGQVRASALADGAPLASFAFQILNAAAGKIAVSLDDTITATLPAYSLSYDMFMTAPGSVKTQILRGSATVLERVTR